MRRELAELRLEVGVGTLHENPDGEMEEDGKPEHENQDANQHTREGALVWRDLTLVDLDADVDAIEKDEDEERSARLAARPSERLAKTAASLGVGAAQVSSPSSPC